MYANSFNCNVFKFSMLDVSTTVRYVKSLNSIINYRKLSLFMVKTQCLKLNCHMPRKILKIDAQTPQTNIVKFYPQPLPLLKTNRNRGDDSKQSMHEI